MDGVVSGLKSWLKFGAPLGIGFWLGLFWRRFNSAGVWVSTLTAYLCWWMTTKPFFISFLKSFPQSEDWGILRSAKGNDVIYEPWDDMFHGWQGSAHVLDEAKLAIDSIGRFCRKVLEL